MQVSLIFINGELWYWGYEEKDVEKLIVFVITNQIALFTRRIVGQIWWTEERQVHCFGPMTTKALLSLTFSDHFDKFWVFRLDLFLRARQNRFFGSE